MLMGPKGTKLASMSNCVIVSVPKLLAHAQRGRPSSSSKAGVRVADVLLASFASGPISLTLVCATFAAAFQEASGYGTLKIRCRTKLCAPYQRKGFAMPPFSPPYIWLSLYASLAGVS